MASTAADFGLVPPSDSKASGQTTASDLGLVAPSAEPKGELARIGQTFTDTVKEKANDILETASPKKPDTLLGKFLGPSFFAAPRIAGDVLGAVSAPITAGIGQPIADAVNYLEGLLPKGSGKRQPATAGEVSDIIMSGARPGAAALRRPPPVIPEGYNILRGREPFEKQEVIPKEYDPMRDVERPTHRGEAVLRENQAIPNNYDIMGNEHRPVRPGVKTTAEEAIKDNGYSLPPKEIGGQGQLTKVGEAVGGKVKLYQDASVKNQANTNRLIAEDLGLPKGTAITKPALDAARAEAGKVYDQVRDVVKTISIKDDNGVFAKAISGIGDRNSAAAKEFPKLFSNKEVDTLTEELSKGTQISGDAAIDLVRKLRDDAKANFRSREHPERAALGFAQRQAADAIEGLIEREISREAARRTIDPRLSGIDAAGNRTGAPIAVRAIDQKLMSLLKEFHEARTRIAKIHNVEDALVAGTDDVSASRLAALQDRGVPLTGKMKVIADTFNNFKKAMQNPSSFGGAEDYSILDAFVVGQSLAHGPAGTIPAMIQALRKPARWNLLRPGSQQRYISPPSTVPGAVVRGIPGALGAGAVEQNVTDAINPPVPLP